MTEIAVMCAMFIIVLISISVSVKMALCYNIVGFKQKARFWFVVFLTCVNILFFAKSVTSYLGLPFLPLI